MDNKIIVFRCDASVLMGIGHVMRCLALANELKNNGGTCYFICRKLEGNLIALIEERGFEVLALNKDELFREKSSSSLFQENWLSTTWENDASQCAEILENLHVDWLVVDHYALDKRWETKLRGFCRNIMVIDDLADRLHDCDLLLDQTYGRKSQDYVELVPDNCQLLLGAQYALLRSEFREWREFSLKRRKTPQFSKLLISMGGTDPENYTGRVLQKLKETVCVKNMEVIVILRAASTHCGEVKKLLKDLPCKSRLLHNVQNMAEEMAKSDWAIGAAGSTTWERCCLGLPSLIYITGEDQKTIGNNEELKTYFQISKDFNCFENDLENVFKKGELYHKEISSIVDGKGCLRVCESLEVRMLYLRPLREQDCELFFKWANDEVVRANAIYRDKITLEEHLKWFKLKLKSHDTQIYILSKEGEDLGQIRFDYNKNRDLWNIDYSIDYRFRQRGLGTKIINLGIDKIRQTLQKPMVFEVLVDENNEGSNRIFTKLKFNLKKNLSVQGRRFICYRLEVK